MSTLWSISVGAPVWKTQHTPSPERKGSGSRWRASPQQWGIKFIWFPARRFAMEYTSYLVGNLPESRK